MHKLCIFGGHHLRTTLAFGGATELILEKAVELGLARSKTDALRQGVFSLNREYNLVKDIEVELAEKKLKREETEMKQKGKRYLSEKEALSKYR
jgi:hypothetical protein